MAAATELTELHDRMNVEVKKLQDIHHARYSRSVLHVVHVLNVDQKEMGIRAYCVCADRTQAKKK